ncbi:MAG: hypothetical protein VX737_03845 [Pseudomonadota bacterium]|nr:hypothetical protein [Pseudomonadota bacterium]
MTLFDHMQQRNRIDCFNLMIIVDGDFDQMTIKKVYEKEKVSPFYEYRCHQSQSIINFGVF